MRILILEDDKQIATLYKRILDEHGFVCDIALNLDEAARLLKTKEYACHLIDLCLKGDRNTGWEIVTQGYRPVIVISALSFERFEFTADVEWLKKPIEFKKLPQIVLNTVKKHNAENANAATG